jgi:hypothetical protein
MTAAEPQATESKLRWYQYRLRTLLLFILIASIGLGLCSWFYQTWLERPRIGRQINATINALARKRPPTMTRGQWGSAVAWTSNLHGNSLLFSQAKIEDLRRFHNELEERVTGPVDMTTILWIWDRYASLTEAGERYQRFRQMMLDEISQVGPNDDPWVMKVP